MWWRAAAAAVAAFQCWHVFEFLLRLRPKSKQTPNTCGPSILAMFFIVWAAKPWQWASNLLDETDRQQDEEGGEKTGRLVVSLLVAIVLVPVSAAPRRWVWLVSLATDTAVPLG